MNRARQTQKITSPMSTARMIDHLLAGGSFGGKINFDPSN
jgi:hypothetical protein